MKEQRKEGQQTRRKKKNQNQNQSQNQNQKQNQRGSDTRRRQQARGVRDGGDTGVVVRSVIVNIHATHSVRHAKQ